MDMEGNRNQNMPSVTLCRAGCGFYGNQAFDGMCSKCYKDVLKRKQNEPVVSGRGSPDLASSSLTALQQQQQPDVSPQQPRTSASTTTTPSVETALPTVPVAAVPCNSSTQDDINTDKPADAKSADDVALGGVASTSASESPDSSGNEQDKKPKKSRCSTCKKKVGLTGFECRCGGLFCSLHRYSDKHDCQFDYREMAAEQIRRNNPVVVGAKIQKL